MLINEILLNKKGWFEEQTLKRAFVIHGSNTRSSLSPTSGKKFTAKDIVDRYRMLNDKNACPFIIDRDGTVTQTFPDTDWAYHLGIFGSHGSYDKQSIGIELINEGGLLKENKQYYINGYAHHQNVYRGPTFEKQFRNFNIWADIDPLQVEALIKLIKHLSKKHFIEPVFYTENVVFDKKVWNKATIFTHANCNANVQDLPLNDWVQEELKKAFPAKKKELEKV